MGIGQSFRVIGYRLEGVDVASSFPEFEVRATVKCLHSTTATRALPRCREGPDFLFDREADLSSCLALEEIDQAVLPVPRTVLSEHFKEQTCDGVGIPPSNECDFRCPVR